MFDSKEVQEDIKYDKLVRDKKLQTYKCLGFWSDICGFSNLLSKYHLNLKEVNDNGVIQLQRLFYRIMGGVKFPGYQPFPHDQTLILNDGIAKTINCSYANDNSFARQFVYFIKELLQSHYMFYKQSQKFDISVRSVLTTGEFIPYARENITGESILQYDPKNISPGGKKILETTYVYNPKEFQMNTAFAKAYTIEDLGTKHNIRPGYFYIEDSVINLLNDIPSLDCLVKENKIILSRNGIEKLILIKSNVTVECLGTKITLYEISEYNILRDFDGDDIIVKFCIPKDSKDEDFKIFGDFLEGKTNEDIKNYLKENNSVDTLKETAFYSANKGNLELIKYLIEEKNLDVNDKDKYEKTILFNACNSWNIALVKYLIQKGTDITIKNKYDETILFNACFSGNFELVKYLIEEKNLDVNIKDKNGRTLLFSADKENILEYLINDKKLDVLAKDKYGNLHNTGKITFVEVENLS